MTSREREALKRKIDEAVRALNPDLKRGARPGALRLLGVRTHPRSKGGKNV